jgi:hypothetical protein
MIADRRRGLVGASRGQRHLHPGLPLTGWCLGRVVATDAIVLKFIATYERGFAYPDFSCHHCDLDVRIILFKRITIREIEIVRAVGFDLRENILTDNCKARRD